MGTETGSVVIEVVGRLESGNVTVYAGGTVDVNLGIVPKDAGIRESGVSDLRGRRVRVTVEALDG